MSPIESPFSRRQAVEGLAFAMGSLTIGPRLRSQQAIQADPTSKTRTSLHQEVDLQATPQRIFEILLDSRQFAAVTGLPAEIDPRPGGEFKTFGGLIVGRNVELVEGKRIVQAWREPAWDPGVYSLVHFELAAVGAGTKLVLDHTGFPEGSYDHLFPGWHERYWNPLKKYLR
jgi:activator of HSP90 ATPase